MDGRRRSETGMSNNQPAMQVVGFHVEGTTPSPGQHQPVLSDYRFGSPTPVTVPPNFLGVLQRSTSQNQRMASGLTTSIAPPQQEPEQPQPTGQAASNWLQQTAQLDATSSALLAASAPTALQAVAAWAAGAADAPAPALGPKAEPALAEPGPSEPRRSKEEGDHTPGPKSNKEMTKAERRAKQEAERAAKAAAKEQAAGGGKAGSNSPGDAKAAAKTSAAAAPADGDKSKSGARGAPSPLVPQKSASARLAAEAAELAGRVGRQGSDNRRPAATPKDKGLSGKSTELFAHLQQFKAVSVAGLLKSRDAGSVHPAILKIGMQYASGVVRGGNARCTALLHAISQVIVDYSTPDGKVLSRDLTQLLNNAINFLVDCRPLSVSMGNAIKFLKLKISKIDPSTPEEVAKKGLLEDIRGFINEKIVVADEQLVLFAVSKVYDGDVILTYSHSMVVLQVLLAAHKLGRRFQVVVVDSRPEFEGRELLKKLLDAGVACTYISVNGLSYIMRQVTKVFLGASAMLSTGAVMSQVFLGASAVLSNGTVMSRAGCAAVAMMAHAHSVPVMICCETYKFHERVQIDSITNNELGDPNALAVINGVTDLQDWQDQPSLGMLNLKYDAMPADYVTMIVTEFGMIPPTSVLVILREYRQET